MGGLQQFGVLLRKNVLLKTRRPYASVLELSMPIVLFLLLGYVRSMYEIQARGPQVYAEKRVFPMTRMLADSIRNSGFVDLGSLDFDLPFGEIFNATWASNFTHEVLCNTEMSHTAAATFELMLNMQVGNITLKQWLLDVDIQSWKTNMNATLIELQEWDVSATVSNLTKLRNDFLASDLVTRIYDLTRRLDREAAIFETFLNLTDGARKAQKRVEGWIDDICNLTGPVFDTRNLSQLVHDIVRMRDSANQSEIRESFNRFNVSLLLEPFYDLFDKVSWPNSSQVGWSKDWDVRHLNTDAEQVAQVTDDVAWWLSHFLQPRSVTARMLGEDADDIDWAEPWTLSFTDPIPKILRTEISRVTYIILKDLQRIQGNHSQTLEIGGPNISRTIDFIRTRAGNLEQGAFAALKNISVFLRDIFYHNLSHLENHTVPEFNRWWRAQCPKVLNRSAIGSLVNRTHRNCPFYKNTVRNLGGLHATGMLNQTLRGLSTWNSTALLSKLSELQANFTRMNVTRIINSIAKVVEHVQALQHSLAETPSKDVAWELVEGIRKEVLLQLNMTPCSSMSHSWNYTLAANLTGLGSLMSQFTDSIGSSGSSVPGNDPDQVQGWIMRELMKRKILFAPYSGEAKALFDLAKVELTLSLLDPNGVTNSAAKALLRCPVVRALTAKIADILLQDRVMTFSTPQELDDYARAYPNNVLAGFVVANVDPITSNFVPGPLSVVYKVRMHAQLLPPTDRIMKFSPNAMYGASSATPFYAYLELGVAYVQEVFGRAAARLEVVRAQRQHMNATLVGAHVAGHNQTELGRSLGITVEQFPNPPSEVDAFIQVIQHTLPMLAVLGWIYAVSLLVQQVVYEKQERLRDVMRIMGLKTWVYWSSWMTSAMVQLTGLVFIMTTILHVFNVLKYSDPTVVFIFFWMFSAASVSLSMLISAFFSRAKVAAACAGMIYYGLYMPYSFYTKYEEVMSLEEKNCLCLLSSTGMGIGMSMIAKWELVEEGIQWSNLASRLPVTYSGAVPADNHSLLHVIMMLAVDVVLYQLLAWYVEKVKPGTLGLPQPWYFPILPSYWCSRNPLPQDNNNCDQDLPRERQDNKKLECWEEPPPGCTVLVSIRNLVKVFAGGRQALGGISLDMHEGMIVGLLGHNGAGKSTTMSILTGLYAPTSGDVEVGGISVRKDSQGVRNQLGVCLQHNSLYDTLTVQEHLRLFCCLKSVPYKSLASAFESLVNDIGLVAKRHTPSMSLSGGMKRKLSIGIALAGNPKVVALDEPTAGVDATSRRDIWNLLAKHKISRTILLSTHFMDEADILSDRIAIIAEGHLTAIGSSMSLKRHFAEGYVLTIVAADGADITQMTSTIRAYVSEASCAGARGREYSYMLPFASRRKFPELFAQLQDHTLCSRLGIAAYGLSAASMEEVFLQASSVHEEGLHGKVRNNTSVPENPSNPHDPKDTKNTSKVFVAEGQRVCTPEGPLREESNSTSAGTGKGDSTPSTCEELPDTDHRPATGTCETSSLAQVQNLSPPQLDGDQEVEAPSQQLSGQLYEVFAQNYMKPTVTQSDPEHPGTKLEEKIDFNGNHQVRGWQLLFQQFWALLHKRALSVRRDRKAWISQLLLPACFVFLALFIAWIMEVNTELPPLKLSTDMLLGTTAAGTVVKSLSNHLIPVTPSDGNMVGKAYLHGLTHGKGSGDELYSIGVNQSMRKYLMQNTKDLSASFGAISIDSDANKATLFFKSQAFHAIPMMVNLWNNARLEALGLQGTKIEVWSHPLPKTAAVIEQELSGASQAFTDLSVAITVILAMGFIPASFIVYLVHERATNGKHQQLLAGVSPAIYWATSYAWDMINFLCPLALCFLIFQGFQLNAFSGANSAAVFLLLLAYGACMTPFMYCSEPLFSVPSTAYVTLICTNIFTGFISVLSTTVMDLYQNEVPSLKQPNKVLQTLAPWCLPNYCLGRGLIDIATNHYINYAASELRVCPSFLKSCYTDPLSFDVAGHFILSLFIMAPAWLTVRLFFEWDLGARSLRAHVSKIIDVPAENFEDDAVNSEAIRVNAMTEHFKGKSGGTVDQLVINKLSKTFIKRSCFRQKGGPMHAVRGISVGVPRGECFGLLGVNGAGKTTTMRMITSDTDIGTGDIFVGGWSVKTQRHRARSHLGYCPQFDALPDKLTVSETLALYARIRAIPQAKVAEAVGMIVKRMCLDAHQNKLCEHLSGGNKRKLSTALALIGEPDVVLLDEPSTGVDVGARRFLWDVISSVRIAGHAVVLTSHSMEECEVLCTRLTIMVHGQFRCLGTPLQLKDKYGAGYTLSIKANVTSSPNDEQPTAKIRAFMERMMSNATLAEESVGLMRYHLKNSSEALLGQTFQIFEEATSEGGVLHGLASDYTMSQTSLEEVFLHFSQLAESSEIDKDKVDKEPAAS